MLKCKHCGEESSRHYAPPYCSTTCALAEHNSVLEDASCAGCEGFKRVSADLARVTAERDEERKHREHNLTRFCDMEAERDAAIARAEKAERAEETRADAAREASVAGNCSIEQAQDALIRDLVAQRDHAVKQRDAAEALLLRVYNTAEAIGGIDWIAVRRLLRARGLLKT